MTQLRDARSFSDESCEYFCNAISGAERAACPVRAALRDHNTKCLWCTVCSQSMCTVGVLRAAASRGSESECPIAPMVMYGRLHVATRASGACRVSVWHTRPHRRAARAWGCGAPNGWGSRDSPAECISCKLYRVRLYGAKTSQDSRRQARAPVCTKVAWAFAAVRPSLQDARRAPVSHTTTSSSSSSSSASSPTTLGSSHARSSTYQWPSLLMKTRRSVRVVAPLSRE